MKGNGEKLHMSLVAIPDTMMSPVSGLYDALSVFEILGDFDQTVPRTSPFRAEIVAASRATHTASGLPLAAHRTFDEVERTDVVIVPSMFVEDGEWVTGRYPEVVRWLLDMHARGAMLCSACSGALLLAETGLLDRREATVHWAYAGTFSKNFPRVRLRPRDVLVITGEREELITSGAALAWHDLLLCLVTRLVGPAAARAISRFMLFQWHAEGQAPYMVFRGATDHGDAMVLKLQEWLRDNFKVARPVEEMARICGLPRRSFERRFTKATGCSPISYVQRLRVEEAKRRLEGTEAVEEISWAVGYEDPAFFRRLFKRLTGITPKAYRRKFRLPTFARPRPERGSVPVPASDRQALP